MASTNLKEVIARAVQNGSFGDNFTFVDLVPSVEEGQDQFASDVIFAKVLLQNGTNEIVVSVVIKKHQENSFLREMMHSDIQFYNEGLMYTTILPFLEKNSILKGIFPKMFHAHTTLGEAFEKDILVIEDLKPFGYKLCEEKVFLNFEHVILVLQKLGRFHALSYASKQKNPGQFLKLVEKLKEPTWFSGDKFGLDRLVTLSMERGTIPLVEAGENVSILNKLVEKCQDPVNLAFSMVMPEEPLAVICHGDFNRNNMLFKYNDAGNPVDVKFFDLATARYASPAIDLAFFLFMNTTADLRRAHWEEFFKIYHDAMTKAIPEISVPSLEVLRLEVEKKAVYGYIHCSFFIPMMLDNTPKSEMDDFLSMSPEDLDEMTRTKGGEKATQIISDIVRDLLRFNSI